MRSSPTVTEERELFASSYVEILLCRIQSSNILYTIGIVERSRIFMHVSSILPHMALYGARVQSPYFNISAGTDLSWMWGLYFVHTMPLSVRQFVADNYFPILVERSARDLQDISTPLGRFVFLLMGTSETIEANVSQMENL